METEGFDMVEVATQSDGTPVRRLSPESLMKFFDRFNYKPHDSQMEFHSSQSRFRVVCAGARWGKSLAAGKEAAAYLMLPNQRWWVVAETYELAEKEFRYVWESLIENPDEGFRKMITGNVKNAANNPKIGQMWIEFKWGSWIRCKSTKEPSGLLGEEVDGVILAEGSQMQPKTWTRYLRQRLSSRGGQLIVPTTPAGYDEFLHPMWEAGQDEDNHFPNAKYVESVESWQFPSWSNPYYDTAEMEVAMKDLKSGILDEADFEEQWGGKFTSQTGKVYKSFKEDIHVVDPYKFAGHIENWPILRMIDVGFDNPTVCLFARISPAGEMVITHEYYKEGVNVQDHCKAINDMTPDGPILYSVIDPAAGQQTAGSVRSALDQYIEGGIAAIPADNSVDAGIMRVSEYLHFILEDGVLVKPPKLYVFSTCSNLIKEFMGYVWMRRRDGGKTNKPQKRNDHGLDALRYGCMSRPVVHRTDRDRIPHPMSFEASRREASKVKCIMEKAGSFDG